MEAQMERLSASVNLESAMVYIAIFLATLPIQKLEKGSAEARERPTQSFDSLTHCHA
jgi:hypothetical protein